MHNQTGQNKGGRQVLLVIQCKVGSKVAQALVSILDSLHVSGLELPPCALPREERRHLLVLVKE